MPKQVVIPPGSGKPLAPYVPGTLADGVLYVSGTLPLDADANVVHVGDAGAQTRHVLETIKGVVEAAGGTMDDVTFNHVFLKDWPTTRRSTRSTRPTFPARSRRAIASSAAS